MMFAVTDVSRGGPDHTRGGGTQGDGGNAVRSYRVHRNIEPFARWRQEPWTPRRAARLQTADL